VCASKPKKGNEGKYSYNEHTSMGASKPLHPKNPVGQKGMDKESYQLLQVKNK
jgi:hypothetical protein